MGATQGHIARDGQWQLDRASKQLVRWLTGFGLLSLDIGLFLITTTALFLLNLYQDPQHIDVVDKVRPWALLIVFHAIAVLILWIMSWALQAGKEQPEKAPQSPPQRSGPVPIAATGGAQTRSRFSPTVSTPVIIDSHEESEHFWRRRSTSIWRQNEPGKQETWSWSSTDEAELTHTWPEGEHFDTAPSSQPYGPFQPAAEINQGPGTGRDVVQTAADQPVGDAVETQSEPVDKVLDPMRFASRQKDSNGAGGEDGVLTRWLWVEAAAAAWLAQREDEPESSNEAAEFDRKPLLPPTEGEPPEALQ
jgi:hypothetical protein